MPTKRDYYEILGVERTATVVEVKTAFKKLALQYHPDKNPGNHAAEESFKECSEAYAILSDEEKRAKYDQFGHAGAPSFPEGFPFGGNINDIFGDIFGEMFGGGGRRRGAHNRGADLRYNLELGFEEAAFGTETRLRIPRAVPCDACGATGSKSHGSSTCPTCHGSGQQRFQQGFFAVARTCTRCGGAGTLITDPCPKCEGEGRLAGEKELLLRVPPGLDDGARVRLQGEGEAGERGGPTGDLYVVVHVRPHPIFKRDDQNVLLELPISFSQAALGAELDVPTLDGKVKLKVPAATQTGRVFRLREKGIPSPNGYRRGDQLVAVRVETPAKLTKEQRELLEKFAQVSGEEQHPQARGFFDKVRELFG
jgi:molecular chaperone DnaJ